MTKHLKVYESAGNGRKRRVFEPNHEQQMHGDGRRTRASRSDDVATRLLLLRLVVCIVLKHFLFACVGLATCRDYYLVR
jgi:hypothetical protein